MAAKKDFSQHALSIVEQLTGDGPLIDMPGKQDAQIRTLATPEKNASAVALGRLGGLKGGRIRAERLTAEQRRDAGKNAAAARWSKKTS